MLRCAVLETSDIDVETIAGYGRALLGPDADRAAPTRTGKKKDRRVQTANYELVSFASLPVDFFVVHCLRFF